MEMIVGCPVSRRRWILPRWFQHVEASCKLADVEPRYIFVLDHRDYDTIDALRAAAGTYGRSGELCLEDEGEHFRPEDIRDWSTPARLVHMVWLRNILLYKVREAKTDLFLSLDSDILLAPQTVSNLVELAETSDADAIGGKCYMTPTGTQFPSYADLPRPSSLWRADTDQVIRVQALMGIKLMKPRAYNVDYQWHSLGEDIGWAYAAMREGLRFTWDGRVPNKHVLSREWLDTVDPRIGW